MTMTCEEFLTSPSMRKLQELLWPVVDEINSDDSLLNTISPNLRQPRLWLKPHYCSWNKSWVMMVWATTVFPERDLQSIDLRLAEMGVDLEYSGEGDVRYGYYGVEFLENDIGKIKPMRQSERTKYVFGLVQNVCNR